MKQVLTWVGMAAAASWLAGCEGPGEREDRINAPVTIPVTIPDTLPSSTSLAQQCEQPRPAGQIDPLSNRPYGDTKGSLATEMAWIRSFVNETYLWYREVPSVSPSAYYIGATVPYVDPRSNRISSVVPKTNYEVVDAYFNSQRSSQLTASGKPRDQFHFTYPTEEWNARSSSGASAGFGFHAALLASSPPRKAVVAYIEPGTPAALQGIQRGTQLLSINGAAVADSNDVDTLNEGLFSPVPGKTYRFVVQDLGGAPRTVDLTAGTITENPVQNVRTLPAPNNTVGYLTFNSHIATAEKGLIDAINQLKLANNGTGISDLVLDLRYNGGGYLALAAELGFMIAGEANTQGKIFEQTSFNDKNPFGLTAAETQTPFYKTAVGFSVAKGTPLPQLGLKRVFILSGHNTCSASEAIINGLRGAGIEVVLIGDTTCGKPYGFYAQDNCSTTYFAIQFKGVNNQGFGDYADGFIPGGTGSTADNVPGCNVVDDLSQQLGDPAEARLAAALQYRATGKCTSSASSLARSVANRGLLYGANGLLAPSPLSAMRLLGKPGQR